MTLSKVHLVVPMRAASARIPEKIFIEIQGKPLLVSMAEHALALQESMPNVVSHLALDSEKARKLLRAYEDQIQIHMTDPELPSGTDRVYAAIKSIAEDDSWIVNLQGDMPFLSRGALKAFIERLAQIDASFGMATMAEDFKSIEDYRSSGIVKALVGNEHHALYFSRLPIPYGRVELPSDPKQLIARSHIGVYAYRKKVLDRISNLPPHPLEMAEGLEQLRPLADGIKIYVMQAATAKQESFRGIDLASDLEWARKFSQTSH